MSCILRWVQSTVTQSAGPHITFSSGPRRLGTELLMIYNNMSRGLIGRDARKQCVVKQTAERPLSTQKRPLG